MAVRPTPPFRTLQALASGGVRKTLHGRAFQKRIDPQSKATETQEFPYPIALSCLARTVLISKA